MGFRLPFLSTRPRVAVIRLSGTIASGRGRLSDDALAPLIERAFTKGKPKAIALVINSPGGSPTQSALIGARIRRLADKHKLPVHAFVEDVAASGGYWLACAADQIWADANSIIGSIGVISAGFGLQDFIARYGIERRVHTSGENKSVLDMFQPEKPEDVAKLLEIQAAIHSNFIAHVKARRGDRLAADPRLFTGEFWAGGAAQDLGLVDGLDHLVPKMQALFGPEVRLVAYGPKRGLLARLGRTASDGLIGAVEDRAAYARYGL